VRNLGFEDTPDYDYLRELFTQALKSTGEVEDGEYDWMKLNNGKGWEAMKAHPSQIHHANALPNSSRQEIHGNMRNTRTPVTPDRLNADLPKPGVRQAPNVRSSRALDPVKYPEQNRRSQADVRPPEGSTMAQISRQDLVPNRNVASPMQGNAQAPQTAVANRGQPAANEQKPTFFRKILNICCCGMYTL
jgi:casein kinase 1